ncbi:ImmA/IrrE family metallo-endopeptidase [Clostridium perfringens]|uniref:ImmA/IrrE family metallo-endopeptidase n=1 Tax=Clostridium perfringens TaxID=1502 RepID=UPI000DF0FA54|nr:ImmA/IrrE family metallo-endopeptidase [Clostridium perfringens]STB41887.1 Plasmid maintenance system antidote protein [Clostridium perfringens]
MNFNYRVATGIIVKEYLDEKEISEEKLAEILCTSKRNVSEFLKGKSGLTEEIANGLEKVLPEISASYWLNLEEKYNEYVLLEKHNEEKIEIEILKDIANKFKFKEVFKGLGWDLKKQAKEMLNILKLDNFNDFNIKYSNLQVDFFEDGGQKEAIAVWLGLCEEEAEFQIEEVEKNEYSHEKLEKNLKLFKAIANNDNLDKSLTSCRKLCNRFGIYFVELEAISNCKVRGALTTFKNHPAIFISRRFKTHDHTWFAIAHELGHLLKHYKTGDLLISMEEEIEKKGEVKEEEANEFARDFFISKEKYNKFLAEKNFTEKNIELFSIKNKIQPGILIARLQHDGYLSMAAMNHKKSK